MTQFSTIILFPLIPWPSLAALAALGLAASLAAFWLRARGAPLRAAGFVLLAAILAGPEIVQETTKPLDDIFLIAVDRSQSMSLGNRTQRAGAALAYLKTQAAQEPHLQTRIIDIPAQDSGGTPLFAALAAAAQNIPESQLAGIAAITDGEIADAPPSNPFDAPLTALIPAAGEETDRELRLLSAPAYGLVGQNVTVTVKILDHGVDDSGATAPLTVTEDGTSIFSAETPIGVDQNISIPIRHAGPAVIALAAAPLPGEISTLNDQAAFSLTGIAKKLQVVLISGNPNQSERTWRLLLKSDPAVELVHFTILRTPSETLDAPPEAIALVPFPVQELFQTDISKFDLIILDEFDSSGLLPPEYLANIASYVQSGGALLVQVGPEFSGPDSLAYTGLAPILPATPAPPGTITQSFAPTVTPLGARDPVTAPFAGQNLAPWQRLEAAAPTAGDTLMTATAANWPLLILSNEGSGRVGMILSDQFWLWTRGGPHAGPALPLLRRVVHWLLREPALEPESLAATIQNNQLAINRQTLSAKNPGDAAITLPDGTVQKIPLTETAPGIFSATLPAEQPGIYKITEGALTNYAALQEPNSQEFYDLAATATLLRPLAHHIFFLGQSPHPALKTMLRRQTATEITGTREIPLFPPLPTMPAALLLLAAAWWRERS
jgi:hypothetical protein